MGIMESINTKPKNLTI